MKLRIFLFFFAFAIFCTACLSSDDKDSSKVTNTIDTSDASVGDVRDASDLNNAPDSPSDASDIVDPGTPCEYPKHNACERGFVCSENGFCSIITCVGLPLQCPEGTGCLLSAGRCTAAGECQYDEANSESCAAAGYGFGVMCTEQVCQGWW